MKGLLVTGLVAVLLLAGCASKDNGTDSSTSHAPTANAAGVGSSAGSASSHPTGTATGTSAPPKANHPPAISAFAAARANATSLRFTFTFAASDPDGDALNWTLDPTGTGAHNLTGAALPGNVTFTYAAAGRFNATLRVTDGANATTAKLPVNATLAPSGPIGSLQLKWTVGSAWCVGYPYNPASIVTGATPYKHGLPSAGVLYGEAAVPAAYAGHRYSADFGAPFGGSGTSEDSAILAFYGADDSYLGGSGSATGLGADPTTPTSGNMVLTGTVPAGSAYAVALNCANPTGLTVQVVVMG